ncbi:HtaA domain-containing protein [Streptomyces sp. TBY4]|uniref:HtaA domain-containing protein n=1 Tax=Streptomyces sp. TBY4 TaxID=2962030 RepID=UPI0020B7794B|nr:HtaA domain-containing protein [Streptomyces sp. TBY4]MCP3758085.1 HtaA domain-containing protein [Streptomyces sp. TBY4]
MSARPTRASAVALLATLAALLGAVLLPATAAQAAGRTVEGGRLDWGIKSSFQSYVTGPVAKGGFKLKEGAATAGGSLFRFHSASGSYDPDSGSLQASFGGGVSFQGHQKPDGTYELDMSASRPTVKISGGSGTLYVDVTSKAKEGGAVTTASQVPFAKLTLGGVNMKGGTGPVVLTGIPAVLTDEGAKAFAGYYAAGAQLDPVSLSVDVKAAAQPVTPSPSTPAATPSPQSSQTAGGFTDAAVDWGVRRTFREYVSGSIGQGKWELAEGAQDGGALFRFPQGKGAYDAAKGTLDAAFTGSVHFTGAHLDLKLAKVTAKVENGKGVLSADVTTGTDTKPAVPLVEFDAKGLKTEGGLATLTEAPATLTEGGAAAFNSMYKAGTEMDPVSLAVALDASAKLPALPNLGSTATPATPPAPSASATPAASGNDSSNTPLYATLAAAAVALAAAATFLTLRRRRTPAQGTDSPAQGPAGADSPAQGPAGADSPAQGPAGTDSPAQAPGAESASPSPSPEPPAGPAGPAPETPEAPDSSGTGGAAPRG